MRIPHSLPNHPLILYVPFAGSTGMDRERKMIFAVTALMVDHSMSEGNGPTLAHTDIFPNFYIRIEAKKLRRLRSARNEEQKRAEATKIARQLTDSFDQLGVTLDERAHRLQMQRMDMITVIQRSQERCERRLRNAKYYEPKVS